LECIVLGGAALTHDVEVFLSEGKVPYVVGYGMSECSPYISAASLHDAKIDAVGYPFKDVSIRIEDPNPETGIGEIWVKGPNVMQGYYKNEAETKNVLTEDGWLKTGDRGYIDRDGYLFIKGRSKNVIIGPSGENIYPEAIESKLQGLPMVEEALVYELDQQLVARIYLDYTFIQRHDKNKAEEAIAADIETMLEDIRVQVNSQLPPYSKIQKVIEQRTPFIKTVSNKIRRAEYVPNYGRDML
jgi:long-chain acyl-CoA synthetase